MVSSFRQGDTELFLVRLTVLDGNGADTPAPASSPRWWSRGPTASSSPTPPARVLMANPAFVEFCQLGSEAQLRGESIDRWLGRPGVDLGVLQANLKQHGAVRLFATTLRGEHGATADVEISAVAGARRRPRPAWASPCATWAGACPPPKTARAVRRARWNSSPSWWAGCR